MGRNLMITCFIAKSGGNSADFYCVYGFPAAERLSGAAC
jgi:hypothetical protein